MRVKIGNQIFDAEDQPIAIELSPKDKENIENMHKDATILVTYPETVTTEFINEWVKDLKKW